MDEDFLNSLNQMQPMALIALHMHRTLMENGATADEAREILQAVLSAFMTNANQANMQMPRPED